MLTAAPCPASLVDILKARDLIRAHIAVTPLRTYPALNKIIGHGIEVWVKHENHNVTNSFKARNALAAVMALDPQKRSRGLVAATKGNHGQGVAWAGRLFETPVTIFVPKNNNPDKNEAMKDFGARVIEVGKNYDQALEAAENFSRRHNHRLIHAANDPAVVAGAATVALEILEQNSDLEAIVLPVGGGSLAAGAILAARQLNAPVKIYGVQAERAAAVQRSWLQGQAVFRPPSDTLADGLSTANPYDLTFNVLREGLCGFVTVSEEEIARAVGWFIAATHNLAEGAAAAGLAGLFSLRETLAGKKVAVVLSGSNISLENLKQALNQPPLANPVLLKNCY
ncbi:MAG: pyridoxal-phosphate dependent enzyme [Elusimicrobia bacterium]|nr:pyridoxal-phosphate dependent enzyme [Elusimicrobiota bacterium]